MRPFNRKSLIGGKMCAFAQSGSKAHHCGHGGTAVVAPAALSGTH
jgi:hypothetical protein